MSKKLIKSILFLLVGVLFFAGTVSAFARSETIALVVNDDAITHSELQDRLKLTLVSSGLPDTEEIKQKIIGQVVSSLIEEQLMMQEAEKNNLKVTDQEIQAGFASIAQQNKKSPEEFKKMIGASGLNVETMFRQIKAQISWSKVVQVNLRPKIIVNDKDVEIELERLKGKIGETEYHVAEIFLPVEDKETEEKDVKELAKRLVNDLKAGKVPFSKVAQQFSKAPGAPQGGDIGWIQGGHLSEELDKALMSMEKNTISLPIRTLRGYHILLLRDTRVVTEESIPDREKIVEKIGLSRLERLARRNLMDIKNAAFIDNRV